MSLSRHYIALLQEGKSVRPRLCISIFNLLHQPGHPHFKELVQIAGGNGEEFQPLQYRIALILGFFQHTPVESHPGSFTVDVVSRIVERSANHKLK